MGEVFRADDLKLGQAVALKFLPPDVDRDPARLTQLHTEVRMARQVSHPNVCRVYDIDEQDGNTFLSMEYVDGEDLGLLLKRVGRFPQERALEIARQICAGLGAAHERGVIHRDLKPANVMIDGTGKVRITDFGLAGVAGEALRAGTPAYMAPEQLAGAEVTVRSDIYALGLVLYEIFTGQRALDANNLAELIRIREQSGIVPPTALVRDLDRDIESTILRCLRPDPNERPASALTVSAALPGGDPLAAALAAGETPSPEMVAAAGETGALSRAAGVTLLSFVLLGLVAAAVIADRVLVVNRVTLPKTADVLQDRARELMSTAAAFSANVGDYARGVGLNTEYMTWAARDREHSAARWSALSSGRIPVLRFWYRTSPRPLMPESTSWTPLYFDPPLALSGMANIVVDDRGRLLEFMTMPPQVDTSTDPPPALDWAAMFTAAGFDIGKFAEVPPQWTSRVYGDNRRAWQGTLASDSSISVRVEGTSYRGRPVYFQVVWPWTRPARMETPLPSARSRLISFLGTLLVIALLLGAIALARHNLKSGRADQQGARRLTFFLISVWTVAWLLGARHYFDLSTELDRFFMFAAFAMLNTGFTWLFYLGLEPYVRRLCPDVLISWTRLLSGHVRDPRVARDALVGIAAGVLFALLATGEMLIPGVTVPGQLQGSNSAYFLGTRYALAVLVRLIPNALQTTMLVTFMYVVLVALVRRRWLAIVITLVLCVSVIASESDGFTPWASVTVATLIGLVALFTLFRYGLLSISLALFTNMVLRNVPLTTDMTRLEAPMAAVALLLVAGAAVYAFHVSRAGEGLFRRLLPA